MKHHWIFKGHKVADDDGNPHRFVWTAGTIPPPRRDRGPVTRQSDNRPSRTADVTVPRLPDGTPNLGRTVVGKGVWRNPLGSLDYAAVLVRSAQSPQGIPSQPWAKVLQQYRGVVMSSEMTLRGFASRRRSPIQERDRWKCLQLPEQKRMIQITEFPAMPGVKFIWMVGRIHRERISKTSTHLWGTPSGAGRATRSSWTRWASMKERGSDRVGHPHSNQMHVVERFTRTSLNTLHVEVTIEDPAAYTRPWTVALDLAWSVDSVIIPEYFCQENNRCQETISSRRKAPQARGRRADYRSWTPGQREFRR